jgi:hypothetical protein
MATVIRPNRRRARLRELAIALAVGAVLLAGVLLYNRHSRQRDNNEAVASTLRKVKAAAGPIRGERFDRVRAASLLGAAGGLIDEFKDVGRPNHVTYEREAMIVELQTGADPGRGCITATMQRQSATFATTRCSASRD